jgi:sRNA-binding protein
MKFIERDDLDRAVEALTETYPKAFFVDARKRRPLKAHIEVDIKRDLASDLDSEMKFYDIEGAVDWYRSHVGYVKSCSIAGTPRLDLQGRAAGKVTEAEALAAENKAQLIFAEIEAKKRARNTYIAPTAPAPRVNARVTTALALKVDNTATDDALLDSMVKHLATLRSLTTGNLVDESLRANLARPVLLLLVDELFTPTVTCAHRTPHSEG